MYSMFPMNRLQPIPYTFYLQDTLTVARLLLGCFLVKDHKVGKIVETEAYIGVEDKASHASWRKKQSCLPMWGPPGHAYVYLTYGIHHLFNIVTEVEGKPCAVLIRALEPIAYIDGPTNGPGRLTKTLGITTKQHNGIDVTGEADVCIALPQNPNTISIVSSKRIGIDYAGESTAKPWRFYIKGNPYVSKF